MRGKVNVCLHLKVVALLLAARRASPFLPLLTLSCFSSQRRSVTRCVCLLRLQVALVFPNNDPVMFMVAFYGCLLAELVPVPIEVPLTRKVNALQTNADLL